MHSNLITHPDLIDDPLPTIVLVNPDVAALKDIWYICTYGDNDYNVYLYNTTTDPLEWGYDVLDRAQTVLVKSGDEFTNPKSFVYAETPFEFFANK